MSALASVVVPAHDEEAVIARCLRALLTGADRGSLEIVVVCNGCTDRTAQIAAEHGVRVVQTSVAGKPAALNVGDEAVGAFPRFYVDADVEVTGAALLAVADRLERGDLLAAAPRMVVDTAGASRAVRDHYRVWLRLPYVTTGHIGSGVVGLSAAGRARFDRFPTAIADDLFLYHLFGAAERGTVDGVSFVVHPARTARALVRRKTRVYAGNAQLHSHGVAPAGDNANWLRVIRSEPALVAAAPAYVAVTGLAKVLARRQVRRGDLGRWARDDSSRSPAAVR